MASPYQSPGVYREEVFLQPEAKLPTGVPGFVGFADERRHQPNEEPVKYVNIDFTPPCRVF